MSRATWKRTERNIAGLIGGERVPVSERQRGDQPDIAHDVAQYRVQTPAERPTVARGGISTSPRRRTGRSVAGGDHPPARRARHAEDIVCMRLADFVQ